MYMKKENIILYVSESDIVAFTEGVRCKNCNPLVMH